MHKIKGENVAQHHFYFSEKGHDIKFVTIENVQSSCKLDPSFASSRLTRLSYYRHFLIIVYKN